MSYARKLSGNKGEELARDRYQERGRNISAEKYTIRGGEIDLVVENEKYVICVEVKVVDAMFDLHGYVTKKKIKTLMKSFEAYLVKHPTQKWIRIDVVFVAGNKVTEVFENITMYLT